MHFSDLRDTDALSADLAVLRRITHIVDADGFNIKGGFWPREMVILQLTDNVIVRYEFKLPCKKYQLSDKESKTVNFVRDNVNGMRFSDELWCKDRERQNAMLPASHDSPVTCLREIATMFGINKCLFAYKGGHCERRWLEKAKLCSINLEVFGCPRFDILIDPPNEDNDYYQIQRDSSAIPHYRFTWDAAMDLAIPCDMHVRWFGRYPPHRPIHCPASECRVFAAWMQKRIVELAKRLE